MDALYLSVIATSHVGFLTLAGFRGTYFASANHLLSRAPWCSTTCVPVRDLDGLPGAFKE